MTHHDRTCLDPLGAQRLQPAHLGLDVVGLDVEVDPRLRTDALHHELEPGDRLAEVPVFGVLVDFFGSPAQRPRPEIDLPIEELVWDIDQGDGELAAMHDANPGPRRDSRTAQDL